MNLRRAWLSRSGLAAAVSLGAIVGLSPAGSGPGGGRALALPAHVPSRCFSAVGTKHVLFGPEAGLADPPAPSPNTSFKDDFNPVNPTSPTTATLPLHTGTSPRGTTYYIITEASSLAAATALGVDYAPKLGRLLNGAVPINASAENASAQDVGAANGNGLHFPAGVNFAPVHIVVPGVPEGFPPLAAQPGAVGDAGYSPFVAVKFNGTPVILNAPQLANPTGRADKVTLLDTIHKTVNYTETDGCYDDESMHYISTDASIPLAAALEDATLAPNLNLVPSAGCSDAPVPPDNCARESLAAFTNGQTGRFNPERQGFNAAIMDHMSPLNNLQEVPHLGAVNDYSPAWDVHMTTWVPSPLISLAFSRRPRQTDFPAIADLAEFRQVTGFPYPTTWGASGIVVNCPVISIDESAHF